MMITGLTRSRFRLLLLLIMCALVPMHASCWPHSAPSERSKDRIQSSPEAQIGSQADCIPRFPDAAGWFGGDAAYSVPLANEKSGRGDPTSLWLFGDSFVERPEAAEGRVYPVVHNTIGLSVCGSGGKWTLKTIWRGRGEASPSAFFMPDPNAEWVREAFTESGRVPYYWLFDGFVAHDTLFVGLLRVVHSEPRGAFNLPFRLAGMDLARIENPHDPPERWRIQLSSLSDDPVAFPGSSFVVAEDHLYAFAFYDRGDGRSPRALTRLPLHQLRRWQPDLSGYLETLVPGRHWEDGFQPDRATILMADDATEMSVHFDPSIERWLAVYTTPRAPNLHADPSTILIRSAPALEGPWSQPSILYTIPETVPDANGQIDPNLFCYAAKAHPQFAPPGSLLVTYVCNLFARNESEIVPILERLAKSPKLYRAKAVSLPIPMTLEAGGAGN